MNIAKLRKNKYDTWELRGGGIHLTTFVSEKEADKWALTHAKKYGFDSVAKVTK